jgi:HPt (histidine-containing phosphotransfer) domain-containing protein
LKDGKEQLTGSRSAKPSPALDPVALDRLRELAEEDAELMPMVFKAFLKDANKRLAGLRDAAGAMKPDKLRTDAHALKGASAEVGAHEMMTICHVLEELGRSQTVRGANELLDSLEQALGRVRMEIDALLGGESS